MRGRTVHDITEFLPENFTGDPNELNEPSLVGDILSTADGLFWVKRESDWTRFLTSANRWDDLRIPATALGTGIGAGNAASWLTVTGYGSLRFLQFSPTVLNETFAFAQLPHKWAKTSIKPHLHIMETGGTGTHRWGLEYSWGNVHDIMPAPTTVYVNKVASGSTGYHDIVSFGEIPVVSENYSSMFICRIFRDATNDNYTTNIALLEFDIHYQTNSNGTIDEIPT